MIRLWWRRRSRSRDRAVDIVGSAGGPPDRRLPRPGAQPATIPDAADVPGPPEPPAPALPVSRAPEPIPSEAPTPGPARVSLGLGADPLVPLASDDPLATELAATADRLLGETPRDARPGGRP